MTAIIYQEISCATCAVLVPKLKQALKDKKIKYAVITLPHRGAAEHHIISKVPAVVFPKPCFQGANLFKDLNNYLGKSF